jgi:hypothetical protein
MTSRLACIYQKRPHFRKWLEHEDEIKLVTGHRDGHFQVHRDGHAACIVWSLATGMDISEATRMDTLRALCGHWPPGWTRWH